MTAYFNKTGWPEKAPKSEEERKEFIASLHKRKTELFMALIEKKLLPLRPGVAKFVVMIPFQFLYFYALAKKKGLFLWQFFCLHSFALLIG